MSPNPTSDLVPAKTKVDLKNLSFPQLLAAVEPLGFDRLRAVRLYKWLWKEHARSFDEMTNITYKLRNRLADHFTISFLESAGVLRSDDGTTKYLWRTDDGHQIESVLIPDDNRLTLCVSTQVGCAMACTFCLTGDLGLKRNLRPAEIAAQPLQVQPDLPEGARITNIVMMGMGEPLHNYDNLVTSLDMYLNQDALNFSHRKVTVSTVGLVPAMQRLVAETQVNLAVSLNATTEEQRREVMPITRRYSLKELMDACRELPLPRHKRITFEYVMMAGFNDSLEDAARLVALLDGVRAKINLIPYNENPDRDIRRPADPTVRAFHEYLLDRGFCTSLRQPRGRDISAACGQLGKADLARMSRIGARNRALAARSAAEPSGLG